MATSCQGHILVCHLDSKWLPTSKWWRSPPLTSQELSCQVWWQYIKTQLNLCKKPGEAMTKSCFGLLTGFKVAAGILTVTKSATYTSETLFSCLVKIYWEAAETMQKEPQCNHSKVTFQSAILIKNGSWHPKQRAPPNLINPCAKFGDNILREATYHW